jgi:two-component system response regulator FlrC
MRLLIVGQLDSHITEATKIAKDQGANVAHCSEVEAAIDNMVSGKSADAIFIDARLDVGVLVKALKADRITVTIIAYGIQNDSKLAVAAIKAGAQEYIPLPPDAELIAAVLSAITQENNKFLYASATMDSIVTMADRIAPSDASVMITGQSGTGKEVIARYIHEKSKRATQPFISVNCAAIPENLLESELFGHEKGAFTGATHRRIGKFEESNNGTLLLDEISEMDVRLQAKLLRAIQEKEIDRVGGTQPIKLNLRILATSNRDLKKQVEEGKFREDLLFRLNVIELKLPPLRERKEDIRLIAQHFVEKYSEENQIDIKPISLEAMTTMQNHAWTGNVRELENTIHRAVLLSTGDEISADALLLEQNSNAASTTSTEHQTPTDFVGRTVDDVEQQLIINTLDHCLGNRTQAATILGISIRTLRNKLNAYSESA